MQVYRGMNIGTAKPTKEEQAQAVHHMIDVCDPKNDFSAAEYAELASKAVNDVLSRKKLPIFCGGTGLYLDAVLTANRYSEGEADPELRASLLADAEKYGSEDLWQRLYRIDPSEAAMIHPNNVKRVARALEIYYSTGTPKSVWDARSRIAPPPFETVKLGLLHERSAISRRIDLRVEQMLKAGLVEEVECLISSGELPRGSTAAQAIGYKEIIDYLDGKTELESAISLVKQSSRRYAKRQMTWFRRDKSTNWLDMDKNFEVIVNNALNLLT